MHLEVEREEQMEKGLKKLGKKISRNTKSWSSGGKEINRT